MSGRMHSDAGYARLKVAARRLAKLAGGVESAASITRVNHSQITKYGLPHDPAFAPVDVVADLETDAGDALVTRELAGMAGFLLIAKPPVVAGAQLIHSVGEVSREVGEAVARCCAALESDGEITAFEINDLNLRGEVREAMEALARIDAMLAVIEAREEGR